MGIRHGRTWSDVHGGDFPREERSLGRRTTWSQPLGAFSGKILAWPGLADNSAHFSSVKMILSKL